MVFFIYSKRCIWTHALEWFNFWTFLKEFCRPYTKPHARKIITDSEDFLSFVVLLRHSLQTLKNRITPIRWYLKKMIRIAICFQSIRPLNCGVVLFKKNNISKSWKPHNLQHILFFLQCTKVFILNDFSAAICSTNWCH